MNKCNSLETIDKTVLSEQTKFRLSEIIGIENYFYQEINQRKSCSKKLNKYVTTFDYIDKILIILSAASGGVSIISFTSIIITSWNNKCKNEEYKIMRLSSIKSKT